jgi:hypothetical protein
MFRPEEGEQIAVVNYLRVAYPRVLFTISPANIKVSIWMGKKIVQMGYNKGTPDLMIFAPRKHYHGLMIEMKKSAKYGKSYPTAEQKHWCIELDNIGYCSHICYGADEAIKLIDDYMRGE